MSNANWVIKDIHISNVAQPSGDVPKPVPTSHHEPRLKRTIMGGPGNRTSIIDCTCGARFNDAYAYVGHDRRMCDWYARHAGIAGGGEEVKRILREYDHARDAIDYPDHPRTSGRIARNPDEILDLLRTKP